MSSPYFPQPASRRSARAEDGESSSSSSSRRGASQPGGQRPRGGSAQGGDSPRTEERSRSGRGQQSGDREDPRREQRRSGGRPSRPSSGEDQGRGRPTGRPTGRSGGRSEAPAGGGEGRGYAPSDKRPGSHDGPGRGYAPAGKRPGSHDGPGRGYAPAGKRPGSHDGPGRGYAPAGGRPRREDEEARTPRQQPSSGFREGGQEEAQHGAGQELAPMLPGVKPVLEFLEQTPERVDAVFLRKGRHGKEMDAIIDLCRAAGVRFSLLDAPSFARVYTGSSQGVVARLFEAGYVPLEELLENVMDAPMPLVLVLDQVQDPGNAGTLARTLYALGGAGLIAPRHNGVYLGAAAAKAAAGALERLQVVKAGNLGQAVDAAKKLGFTVYGATAEVKNAGAEGGDIPSYDPLAVAHDIFSLVPRFPAMLVLGGEDAGLRPNMLKRCDVLVKIPMLRDFDSINVAQAGAIILSWFANQIAKKS